MHEEDFTVDIEVVTVTNEVPADAPVSSFAFGATSYAFGATSYAFSNE